MSQGKWCELHSVKRLGFGFISLSTHGLGNMGLSVPGLRFIASRVYALGFWG